MRVEFIEFGHDTVHRFDSWEKFLEQLHKLVELQFTILIVIDFVDEFLLISFGILSAERLRWPENHVYICVLEVARLIIPSNSINYIQVQSCVM